MSCVGDFALGGREEEVNFHVKTIRSPFYYCAVFYNGEGRRRKSVRFFTSVEDTKSMDHVWPPPPCHLAHGGLWKPKRHGNIGI